MATIVYRNAILFVNGAELTAALHELAIEYAAEMLDNTVMGDDTRSKTGGLFTGSIKGKGFFETAVGIENVLFSDIPDGTGDAINPAYQNGSQIGDTLFVLFPDGITENSVTTGIGFAMKGAMESFKLGGTVGQLLDIDFSAQSRGIGA